MKKSKLTLGLVTSLLSVGALASCNEVTYADGVVLEYTDAQGQVTKITATDLFGDQHSSSVASTDFDKIYEVLVRKYYQSGSGASSLAEIEASAKMEVQKVKDQAKKNADNNKTSYSEELSKLLASNDCDNIDELYQAKLYSEEKKVFEDSWTTDARIKDIRDGNGVYTKSEAYGVGSDGYLVEQMPYTISHILVKLSQASNGEHAQATITEKESRKLGQVVQLLAGADITDEAQNGKKKANTRTSFGDIAHENSEDGSNEKFGQLGVMDRDQADSFINEFKFGIYSFESIYNQMNVGMTEGEYNNPFAAEPTLHANSGETYALTSKIRFTDNATYTDTSAPQTQDEIDGGLAEGEHYVKNFFFEKEVEDNEAPTVSEALSHIGVIPFGAAVALAKDSVAKNEFYLEDGSRMNWDVNGNSQTFYPRNILFNKYFNNHRVAVIVPNEIAYNDPHIAHPDGKHGDYRAENFVGEVNDAFKALPGFSTFDTKSILPANILGQDTNVLTTEKGQIVLAVRGGSSGSYEGVHFIVIDRSALEQYVRVDKGNNNALVRVDQDYYDEHQNDDDVTSLSEFYTISKPKEVEFPTYVIDETVKNKTTYVNQLNTTNTNYDDNRKAIREKISTYNSNKNTYMFQTLIEDSDIQFGTNAIAQDVKELIEAWVSSKRNKSVIDRADSFDDTWATYIEYLTAQDQARALNEKGTQRLISETCAIGYSDRASDKNSGEKYQNGIWSNGGACYAK